MAGRKSTSFHRWILPAFLAAICSWLLFKVPHSGPQQRKLVSEEVAGHIPGTDQKVENVEDINEKRIRPIVRPLVTTPFFKFFRVRMECACEHWPEEMGMCGSESCGVGECTDEEVPPAMRERVVSEQLASVQAWREEDNPWTHDDEADDASMVYVSLLRNPERDTGYVGEQPRRIWREVHQQSCAMSDALCRVASGFHASVSVHIASERLRERSSFTFRRDRSVFFEKVASRPERLKNLHYTFLLAVRALQRASPFLLHANYSTGSGREDERAERLVSSLVDSTRAIEWPTHEPILEFLPEHALRTRFRNITSLMDCVSCDRCRLWGKLQSLGIATALRSLYRSASAPVLGRTEAVALVNFLARLSESVHNSKRFLGHQAGALEIEMEVRGSCWCRRLRIRNVSEVMHVVGWWKP